MKLVGFVKSLLVNQRLNKLQSGFTLVMKASQHHPLKNQQVKIDKHKEILQKDGTKIQKQATL